MKQQAQTTITLRTGIFLCSLCLAGLAPVGGVAAQNGGTDTRPDLLAAKICSSLGGDGNRIVEDSYKKITKHMHTYGGHSATPTEKHIIEFLNKNNKNMICGDKKHYMHAAIEEGRGTELFRALFLGKLKSGRGNPIIDVNAACQCGTKGEWETPLDYLIRYKNDNSDLTKVFRAAESLEKTLIKKFNAKHFHELPKDVQQAYRQNRP